MYLAHTIDQFLNSKSSILEMKKQYQVNPDSFFELSNDEFENILDSLTDFYGTILNDSGLDGYVVGLSGGIDSSVVASLLVKAVGNKNVKPLLMPSSVTSKNHIRYAVMLSEQLNIEFNKSGIDEFKENFELVLKSISNVISSPIELNNSTEIRSRLDRIRIGNIHARLRMIILRDFAKQNNSLVAGTGNATEESLGYFTLAGDGLGGVDNEGIGGLYKTQIFKLAKYLDVPQQIIDSVPTAGLYEGQTDEKELGASYEVIDMILVGKKIGMTKKEVSEVLENHGVTSQTVKHIYDICEANIFKTKLPPKPIMKTI